MKFDKVGNYVYISTHCTYNIFLLKCTCDYAKLCVMCDSLMLHNVAMSMIL